MPIPYAPSRVMFDPSDRASAIVLRQGENAAEAARRSGQIWGGAIQNLGGIATDAVGQYQEQKAMSRRDQAVAQLWEASGGNPDVKDLVRIYGPKDGVVLAKNLAEFNAAKANPRQDAIARFPAVAGIMSKLGEPLQEAFWNNEVVPVGQKAGILSEPIPWKKGIEQELLKGFMEKPAAPTKLGANERLIGPDGKEIVGVIPEPFTPARPQVVGRSLVGPDGKVIYRDPDPAKAGSDEKIWVMRPTADGKVETLYVPKTQVQQGDRPASTREQGRPVTSGDAGRIAELDTSLDDLAALGQTLGKTGAGSQIGAMLPNVVTEFTGWGQDSKQRQAMIDRVKQVIGKALEGGVLRKEDEVKYEKILPRIGDDPEVARTKLENLQAAILQRRERELDAREDAGYDVTRFRQRELAKPPVAKTGSSGQVSVTTPDGQTFVFPSAAAADGFKKRAGIK